MKRYLRLVGLWLCGLFAGIAHGDVIPTDPTVRHTGNVNYVVVGGSLRNSSTNVCTVAASDTKTISGIPAGASIKGAYLYWGGSGNTDSQVSLSGVVNADRTFTTTAGGNNFFGGFANITSRITGNNTVTFGDLTVSTGNPWCSAGNVMAGWALVVVYEHSSEPLRAINIFDGLQEFYNSSITLNPTGFRIPATGIDGKFTAITWEGDDTISGASEYLTFNSNAIDLQGFDSSSHFSAGGAGVTTYGADIDTFNISSYLTAGQTQATTFYQAGGDRVFLAAQIISVTSEPQVDLSITKSHSGTFTVNTNATYTLHVANAAGVQQVDYLTTVTDALPAGLTYVSGIGTGWSCSASGQTVTCTHAAPLVAGAAFPDITITVAVGNAAYPSVSNTATVSTAGSNDYVTSNNTATDVATVTGSNLSTSTKTVTDLNGGEANAGDTLRYTITINNSTAVNATGVSVSDALPGNTTNLQVYSFPSGATNTSTTAQLNVSNIAVPANGSVTIVFDVTIINGTSPGALIDNTATVSNPAGTGATPAAPTVTVSPSLVAGTGTKQLYLWNNGTLATKLYRTPPSGSHTDVVIAAQNGSTTFTITPALQKAVTLRSGGFPVYLWLARSGSSTGNNRSVTVTLTNSVLGTISTVNGTVPGTASLVSFTLPLASNVTAPVGSTFALTVTNTTTNNGRTVTLSPYNGTNYSRVELNSLTVLNVDSVQHYNAAYNGGAVASSFLRGTTAYVRAVVSDPFGSYDISSASITLKNPSGTAIVTAAAMTQVADSNAATKTFEYSYAIPGNAAAGVWTAEVTAKEGTENQITDLGVGTFTVTLPMPTLQVTKVSNVVWDPINLSSNPKRIPGSIISYSITVTNSGAGIVDASTLVMTDVMPANTSMCVANVGQCTIPQFADGTPVSGLSYSNGNTTYSSAAGGGPPFSYIPAADANGIDAAITGFRIAPTGAMNGAGSGNPSFTLTFRVKLN